MQKITALLLTVALCLTPSVQADELELKGLKMGASMDDFLKLYPFHPSGWSTDASGGDCPKERKGFGSCEIIGQPFPTIAGIWVTEKFWFNDDKLVKITGAFEPDSFEEMLNAFIEKYAKPTSLIKTEMTTRMGVNYTNVIAIWNKAGAGEIRLVKYNGTIDESMVTFSSSWMLQHDAQKETGRAKAASKDL